MEKQLGKLSNVSVGFGGYQDAMLGVSFTISGKGWGTTDFWGTWGHEPDKYAKWTKADQAKVLAETMLKLGELLNKAKVQNASSLIGKPVEVAFENMRLVSWRILEEVI